MAHRSWSNVTTYFTFLSIKKGLFTMVWLILFLIIIPAIEIGIFLWTSTHLGVLPVVLLIVLTGIAGVALCKHEGAEVWKRAQFAVNNKETPTNEILDGICIILGGICLITPGLFTDILGFLLVLPFTRPPFRKLVGYMMMKYISKGNMIFRRW